MQDHEMQEGQKREGTKLTGIRGEEREGRQSKWQQQAQSTQKSHKRQPRRTWIKNKTSGSMTQNQTGIRDSGCLFHRHNSNSFVV